MTPGTTSDPTLRKNSTQKNKITTVKKILNPTVIHTLLRARTLALDLTFPKHCPFCDGYTAFGQLLCPECRQEQESEKLRIREPFCLKCGKAIQDDRAEYCRDCRDRRHDFTQGRSLYRYAPLAPAIYRFKYEGRREYGEYFGKEMAKYLGPVIRSWRPDLLIPVPLHPEKLEKRGFNQAQVLAETLGRELKLPVEGQGLLRVNRTLPQKLLDREQRHKNLQNAFKIGTVSVKSKKVILVDDIYTTGSTVDACARVLLRAGAQNVYFITLATGQGI